MFQLLTAEQVWDTPGLVAGFGIKFTILNSYTFIFVAGTAIKGLGTDAAARSGFALDCCFITSTLMDDRTLLLTPLAVQGLIFVASGIYPSMQIAQGMPL